MSVTDRDLALADAGRKKINAGKTPNRAEKAAIARLQKVQRDRIVDEFIVAVPKREYCRWASRSIQVVNNQADLYGFPIRGPEVDIRAVIERLHDFLGRYGRYIRQQTPEEMAESALIDGASPALKDQYLREQIRERRAKATAAELAVAATEGGLVPGDAIQELLMRVAGILRQKGESLGRQFGPAAAAILEEGLDDCEREIADYFADRDPPKKGRRKRKK